MKADQMGTDPAYPSLQELSLSNWTRFSWLENPLWGRSRRCFGRAAAAPLSARRLHLGVGYAAGAGACWRWPTTAAGGRFIARWGDLGRAHASLGQHEPHIIRGLHVACEGSGDRADLLVAGQHQERWCPSIAFHA